MKWACPLCSYLLMFSLARQLINSEGVRAETSCLIFCGFSRTRTIPSYSSINFFRSSWWTAIIITIWIMCSSHGIPFSLVRIQTIVWLAFIWSEWGTAKASRKQVDDKRSRSRTESIKSSPAIPKSTIFCPRKRITFSFAENSRF